MSLVGFKCPHWKSLDLSAVAQVACVAEAWHDIFVLVQSVVDSSAPDGGVLRECLTDMFDALW